jgi:hypothetical protein
MQYTIPISQPSMLGSSVDIITGQVVRSAVFSITAPLTVESGANATLTSNDQSMTIETEEDYSSLLKMAAGVEGSGWTEDGEGSVSTSAQYMSSQQISSQSIAVVRYSGSQVGLRMAQLGTLTLPASMAQQIIANPQQFLKDYGTHVVVGQYYGGSILYGLKITTVTAAASSAVKTAFKLAFNDFEVAKGDFTGSLQDAVNTYSQQIQISALVNKINVHPPQLSINDLAAMNTYMDTQFQTDVGVGGPIAAVCLSWDMLPCVYNLTGYSTTTPLVPPVDDGIVQILRDEFVRLQYAQQTAMAMQSDRCYVGQQTADALQADIEALDLAISAIRKIDVMALQNIDSSNVNQYVVSQKYIDDLQDIAGGRAAIAWKYGLDGAFTPNTVVNGVYYPVNGPTQTLLPTADTTPQVLLTSNHGSDGNLQLGVVYQLVNSDSILGTALEDQAQLSAVFANRTGPAIGAGLDGAISTVHYISDTDPTYGGDFTQVWFAESTDAAAPKTATAAS